MRLFVDENLGHTIGRWLREQGHDVFAVIESCRGARDPDLLRQAAADGRVIVTADKGFGELVFRARLPHAGVILLRMGDRRPPTGSRSFRACWWSSRDASKGASSWPPKTPSAYVRRRPTDHACRPALSRPQLVEGKSEATTIAAVNTMSKIGRNDPCPCGSGRKFKKCHGLPSGVKKSPPHVESGVDIPFKSRSASIPLTGLPGLLSQLLVHNEFEKADPRNEGPLGGLPGRYNVVLTLARPGASPLREPSLAFESGVRGDSFLAITPPALPARPGEKAPVRIVITATSDDGVFEFKGEPNEQGYLAKLRVDGMQASDLTDAQDRAHRAIASFLSAYSLYLDIPMHVYQVDVTEVRTGASTMQFRTPFFPRPAVALPSPTYNLEFRRYASIYREALCCRSSAYEFLCYYKIIEGLKVRRNARIARAKEQGVAFSRPARLLIPVSGADQEAWIQSLFPYKEPWDPPALAAIFPPEVLGKRASEVIDRQLRDLRNRIAHAILDSGQPTFFEDDGHDALSVNKWLPLTKCMARAFLREEFPDAFG